MLKLPPELSAKMKTWRISEGMLPLPEEYNTFHAETAKIDANKRVAMGDWVILEYGGLVNDGFGDGAKFVQMIIESRDENGAWTMMTVKWHESGAWFRKSHGWVRQFEMIGD